LSVDRRGFLVQPILDGLRDEHGHSEFGYRMQALLAHVLLRLGARIVAVKPQGHPDIKATFDDRVVKVQVKTIAHLSAASQLIITQADVAGISGSDSPGGYLAVLDCAPPVAWLLVPEERLRLTVDRPTFISTFRADRHAPLSDECTDEFLDLVLAEAQRLPQLTFRLLADRALRGEPL
jgi:hypothetical protein